MIGAGTLQNPYIITSLYELQSINNSSSYYILGNDIDGENITINPISLFNGSLDGKGFTIKNLTITQISDSITQTGLFGRFDGGDQSIENLTLDNIRVGAYNPTTPLNFSYVSPLVGYETADNLLLKNVHVKNSSITSYCSSYAGGLVGYGYNGNLNIVNCSVENISMFGNYVGGLVGYSYRTNIAASYSTGTISTNLQNGTAYNYAGGLIGFQRSSSTSYYHAITNCYSKINFTLGEGTLAKFVYVGGLVGACDTYGKSSITNSYYAGTVQSNSATNANGLVGRYGSYELYTNAYIDSSIAGMLTYTTGAPKTTDQMKDLNVLGWGFPWEVDATGVINGGYPYLSSDVTNKPLSISCANITLNNTLAVNVIVSGISKVLYNYGETLPNGVVSSGFGSMPDPTNTGHGNVISNYGHELSQEYSIQIPLVTPADNCSIVIEYFVQTASTSNYAQMLLDGSYNFSATGYAVGGVPLSSSYFSGIKQDIVTGQWSTFEIAVPAAGTHTIKFTYRKNATTVVPGILDGIAIGKIYLKERQVYANKTSYTNLMKIYPSSIVAKVIGQKKLPDVEIKSPTMVSSTIQRKPKGYILKDTDLVDFQSALPSGSVTSSYAITSDLTNKGKGNILCNTNRGVSSSTAYVTIPITLTSVTNLSIDYYFSSEGSYDKLALILNGSTKLSVSGSTSTSIHTNTDTTTNPSSNIKPGVWQTYTIKNVAAGTHTLKIQYTKDSSGNSGDDIGAVSKIYTSRIVSDLDTDANFFVPAACAECKFYQMPYGDEITSPVAMINAYGQEVKLVNKLFWLEKKIDEGEWFSYKFLNYYTSSFSDIKDLKNGHTYQYRITDLTKIDRVTVTSEPFVYVGIENSFNELKLIDKLYISPYDRIKVSGDASIKPSTMVITKVFKTPITKIINNLTEIYATSFATEIRKGNPSLNIHYYAIAPLQTETIGIYKQNIKQTVSIYRHPEMCRIDVTPKRVVLLDASKMGSVATKTLTATFKPPALMRLVEIKAPTTFALGLMCDNIGTQGTIHFGNLHVTWNEAKTSATATINLFLPSSMTIENCGWEVIDRTYKSINPPALKSTTYGGITTAGPVLLATTVDAGDLPIINGNPVFDQSAVRAFAIINGLKYFSDGSVANVVTDTKIYVSNPVDARNGSVKLNIFIPKTIRNIIESGVYYSSINPTPSSSDNKALASSNAIIEKSGFYINKPVNISGLEEGAVYCYRAYVKTDIETYYSPVNMIKVNCDNQVAELHLAPNNGANFGFNWSIGNTNLTYDRSSITRLLLKVEELYINNPRTIIEEIPIPTLGRGGVPIISGEFRDVFPGIQYRVTVMIKPASGRAIVLSENILLEQPYKSELVYL